VLALPLTTSVCWRCRRPPARPGAAGDHQRVLGADADHQRVAGHQHVLALQATTSVLPATTARTFSVLRLSGQGAPPGGTLRPVLTEVQQMQTETKPARLGVDEFAIAAELGLSVHTVRKDRVKGRRIPYFKIGTTVRYNVERVREALACLEVGGPAARPTARR
jgi:hypothetical protein